MIEIKRIFPECWADTLLVELLLERGKPAHYYGISKVDKALKLSGEDGLPIYGLVDSDRFKNTPTFISEFVVLEDYSDQYGLILKQFPNSLKYIVVVCPGFERWIWERARETGVHPKEYGYSSIEDLKKSSKSTRIDHDANFKKFVNKIVRSENAAIRVLRSWLSQVFDQ